MKTCEDFELLINLSLDGLLTETEQKELNAHLNTCENCRKAYSQLKILTNALGELEEPIPPELHAQIMSAVEKEAMPKVRKFPLRRICSIAAAAAACAAIGLVALRFAPSLDFAAQESLPDRESNLAIHDGMPDAPKDNVQTAMPAPGADSKPSQNVVSPNVPQQPSTVAPDPSPSVPPQTGQIAEDLPPLRQESNQIKNDPQYGAVFKWLKVTGKREDMPEWVDWSSVYTIDLDGVSYEYLQIQDWAETIWLDHFSASGFTVEEMEGVDTEPTGDTLLLFFLWN